MRSRQLSELLRPTVGCTQVKAHSRVISDDGQDTRCMNLSVDQLTEINVLSLSSVDALYIVRTKTRTLYWAYKNRK